MTTTSDPRDRPIVVHTDYPRRMRVYTKDSVLMASDIVSIALGVWLGLVLFALTTGCIFGVAARGALDAFSSPKEAAPSDDWDDP